MNDHAARQLARVAELTSVADPSAVVSRWCEQRATFGRPIGSAAAVLARMSDDEIRADLGRFAQARSESVGRCPDCHGEGWLYPDPANPNAAQKCTHPRKAIA